MNQNEKQFNGFETKAIRTQSPASPFHEHSVPIYMTSSYRFDSAEDARDIFAGSKEGNIYSRYSNPNPDEFVQKLCLLEDAEDGIATASGMAAIFACIMGLCKAQDHIVASKALFGTTLGLFETWMPRFGMSVSFVDLEDTEAWEQACRKETRLFYLETPSNPALSLGDIKKLSELAHSKGIYVVVDNCFASPYVQNPLALGADFVCHSATKFLDGQGRSLGGAILGPGEQIEEIRNFTRASGPCMSPFNAWLLSKSLETLGVRMERHCLNALKTAEFLENHPAVERVLYPGLASHPQHALAQKQMHLGGGLCAFELKKGLQGGIDFLNSLKMISISANLGDTRTIATHPVTTTHAKLTEDLRQELGIRDGLIRISLGLETLEDILKDLDQALSCV